MVKKLTRLVLKALTFQPHTLNAKPDTLNSELLDSGSDSFCTEELSVCTPLITLVAVQPLGQQNLELVCSQTGRNIYIYVEREREIETLIVPIQS